MSRLDAHNAKSAQSKDVKNENMEFLTLSAVCLLSAACLLFSKSHIEACNTKTAQSKYVWNENLEISEMVISSNEFLPAV